MWCFSVFQKIALTCLLGIVFKTDVCCSQDVHHRIILQTHIRQTRDRGHHKYHEDLKSTRKPTLHELYNDDFTTITPASNSNTRSNYRNITANISIRGKLRNATTPKFQNIAEMIEFTTLHPEKLPVTIIETPVVRNIYKNATLNYFPSTTPKLRNNVIFREKNKQPLEKDTQKNSSKGYEVYEIYEDVSPPPLPSIKNIFTRPRGSSLVSLNTIVLTENDVRGNISEYLEGNKTYGKRLKSTRSREN